MSSFFLRGTSLVALALAAAACGGDNESPTAPTEPPANTIVYTVFGASDGLGVGSSVVCQGCDNGTGYAQTIRRRWVAEGRVVDFRNLSVPGMVLSPAIADLAIALGRGDPGNMLRAPGFMQATTTHVTVFAGGNDANVIGSSIAAGAGGSDIRGYIDNHVRQWGTDLVELISRIRGQAPNARIVAFNLPNLGAAPYMAGRPSLERSMMQRIATGLSDQVNSLTSRGVIVVDLLCDPRSQQPGTYSSDGFHPSDAGYALMADLGHAALTAGSAPGPQPSCGGRTVLPVF